MSRDDRAENLISSLGKVKKMDSSVNSESVKFVLSIVELECLEKLQCKTCSHEEMVRCLKMYGGKARVLWCDLLNRRNYRWANKSYGKALFNLMRSMLKDIGTPYRLWHKELHSWVEILDIVGDKAIVKLGNKVVESPIELYDLSIKDDSDLSKRREEEAKLVRDKVRKIDDLHNVYVGINLVLKRKFKLTLRQKVYMKMSRYNILCMKRGTHKLFVWRKDNSVWMVPTEKLWKLRVAIARKETLDFLKEEAKCISHESDGNK